MEYAFVKMTKLVLGEDESVWVAMKDISSVTPRKGSSLVYYNSCGKEASVVVKESPEEIFNSVIFISSPSSYFVKAAANDEQ